MTPVPWSSGTHVTGGLESLRLSIFRCKRERLIMECFNYNKHILSREGGGGGGGGERRSRSSTVDRH